VPEPPRKDIPGKIQKKKKLEYEWILFMGFVALNAKSFFFVL
jgi:hypothetical protein